MNNLSNSCPYKLIGLSYGISSANNKMHLSAIALDPRDCIKLSSELCFALYCCNSLFIVNLHQHQYKYL